MRSKLTTLLTVIGATTVLVLAANTVALATTGKAILAGKVNTSSKLTSIVRSTPGTGLQVKTKSTANAPFAVNGAGKVVNLNADKVDGLDGGTRILAWKYSGNVTGDKLFKLTGLPTGTYLINYEAYMSALSSADGLPVSCMVALVKGLTVTTGGFSDSEETAASYPGLSGTALITKAAGTDVGMYCNVPTSATWTAPAEAPVRISAVPIAGTTNKGVPTVTDLLP